MLFTAPGYPMPILFAGGGVAALASKVDLDNLAARGIVPIWLEKRTLDELMQHNRLGFSFTRIYEGWPFLNESGEIVRVPPAGNALISDGDAMRHLALAGLGIARLSAFHVTHDLAEGRLVTLLENLNPGDISPVTAIFAGQSGYVPARVRALLDYLVENVRLD